MIISADGIVTRTPVKEKDPRQGITAQGRSTQGVRLMRLDSGDKVVSITSFDVEKGKASSKAEKDSKGKSKAEKDSKGSSKAEKDGKGKSKAEKESKQ